SDVERREQGETSEVPEPDEGEARCPPRRCDGGERSRVLERPSRGSPARADLPDARAARKPTTSTTPLIRFAWIGAGRGPINAERVGYSARQMKVRARR